MSSSQTHTYGTRTALRNRTNTASSTAKVKPQPTTRTATTTTASNNNSDVATDEVEIIRVVRGPAGATQANVAVRSSAVVRPDKSSQRKRKIETQASFLVPNAAAKTAGNRVVVVEDYLDPVDVVFPISKARRNEPVSLVSSPASADVAIVTSTTTAATAATNEITVRAPSPKDQPFTMRGPDVLELTSNTSPYFCNATPYKPPTRNAQATLTFSSAESFTAEDDLECIDETAALLEKREEFYSASPTWISLHPELKPSMRAILLDWLRELSCPEGGYKLSRVTYQTAVNVFDRFMSVRGNVPRTKVQLIGAAVLLIASKLEESYRAPNVETLLFYCDGLYKRHELLKVESLVLRSLDWRVTPPTPHVYAKLILTRKSITERQSQMIGTQTQHRELRRDSFDCVWLTRAMQIVDAAMLDNECLRYRTSTLAISALACVRIKYEGESIDDAFAAILPHYVPQLPEAKAAMTARVRVSQTPALVAHRVTPGERTVSKEQRACVLWMAQYTDMVIADQRYDDIEYPLHEQQDWNKLSLERVRTRLRERAREHDRDPTRVLSYAV